MRLARSMIRSGVSRVSGLVSDTMIARRLSTKTLLTGIHAFLMALEESGQAETFEVVVELTKMAESYSNLISFVWDH
jgi:hypothetical protein